MERFIVGSGRCGSTLLNNMLAKHPDVAMFSEFFATIDRTEWCKNEVLTGAQFSEFLSRPAELGDILIRRDLRAKEMMTDVRGLFTLPGLFVGCIPPLSATPEILFQELLAQAATFPTQRMAQQIRDLFDWLAGHLGKTAWVERSGPSIQHLPELAGMFPGALYVHLHRDGPEAALSMSQHQYFQLEASFFFNPPDRAEIEATEYAGHPVTADDPFSRRLKNLLPLEKFGEYWSYMQIMAYRGLARLSPAQVLDVQFEDLIAAPHETMQKIADFLNLPARPDWVNEAAKLVEGTAPARFDKLDPEAREALENSCRTGRLLLGREDLPWTTPTLELIKEIKARAAASPGP